MMASNFGCGSNLTSKLCKYKLGVTVLKAWLWEKLFGFYIPIVAHYKDDAVSL
jgi:hypothetical protein